MEQPEQQQPIYQGKTERSGKLRKMLEDGRSIQRGQRARRDRNRRMYRTAEEMSDAPGVEQTRRLTRDIQQRGGTTRVHINRARKMIDGRVAIFTSKQPPLRNVKADESDLSSIEAARKSGIVLESFWREQRVQAEFRNLVRHGMIDGVSVISVNYDSDEGPTSDIPTDPNGEPIMDPNELVGWERAGMVRWEKMRLGDVVVRSVRANSMAFDPNFRTDFRRECRWVIESRIRPKDEVEGLLGMSWEQAEEFAGNLSGGVQEPTAGAGIQGQFPIGEVGKNLEADAGRPKALNDQEVVVHELFATPHGDFPQGAHMTWADQFPMMPWVEEPWDDELPYDVFVERPDGGHLLLSLSTMDDLYSVQVRRDTDLQLQHDYVDMAARPPIMVPKGSMRTDTFWNDQRIVEWHPALGTPYQFQVPSEPSVLLGNSMEWHTREMEELSDMSGVVRGQPVAGSSVNTASQYQQLIQQSEIVMAETQENLKAVMEWTGGRILRLIEKHYIMPRKIDLPGIEDTGDLAAFEGRHIKGQTNFRIDTDLMPMSKAMQIQTIKEFAAIFGDDLKPFLGDIISGDPTHFVEHRDKQRDYADEENQLILNVARNPIAQQIWQEFERLRVIYIGFLTEVTQALQQAQADGVEEALQYENAEHYLAVNGGMTEPNYTAMLQDAEKGGAEIDVPFIDDFDDDGIHLKTLDDFCCSQNYRMLAKKMPWYQHMVTEHRHAHSDRIAQRENAMAIRLGQSQETGSDPKELGEASQPSQSQATPGSSAGMPQMPGG